MTRWIITKVWDSDNTYFRNAAEAWLRKLGAPLNASTKVWYDESYDILELVPLVARPAVLVYVVTHSTADNVQNHAS